MNESSRNSLCALRGLKPWGQKASLLSTYVGMLDGFIENKILNSSLIFSEWETSVSITFPQPGWRESLSVKAPSFVGSLDFLSCSCASPEATRAGTIASISVPFPIIGHFSLFL